MYGTLLFLIFSFQFHTIFGVTIGEQPNLFEASITTDKNEYYIYEEIIANFTFSSHITVEDYFSFALAPNISFNPIFESEPVQGNFSISKIYEFSLIALNYTFDSSFMPLYILLYYRNGLFGDEICCFKLISIHKANLECLGPENFTEIQPNTKYYFDFLLQASENPLFPLKEKQITYTIKYNDLIFDQCTILTDASGSFSIEIQPNKKTLSCEIWITVNTSEYFSSLSVVYHFKIGKYENPARKYLILIGMISITIIIGISSIYFGLKLYNKYLKRSYQIKTLKI